MKEYRVEATGLEPSGKAERFLIVTTSRERALHFAEIFMANPEYTAVAVEWDGKIWIGSRIGEIP